MNIGKQSTLNDLQNMEQRITDEVLVLSSRVDSFESSSVTATSADNFFQPSNSLFNKGFTSGSPEDGQMFNAVRIAHNGGERVATVFSQSHLTKRAYVSHQRTNLAGDVIIYTDHQELLTNANTIVDANGFIKAA